MIHLRVIAPRETADAAIDLMRRCESVTNLIVHRGVALEPEGDMLSCDVAEEDASFVIGDLRRLGIPETGSIDVDRVDATLSSRARAAEAHAPGRPADAVIWENVAARTSEDGRLSFGLVALFVLSGIIAAVAILIDSSPIVVGAMAVSPDFGPIAVFAVGAVRLRPSVALPGLLALTVGFTAAIMAAFLAALFLKATGVAPREFFREDNVLATSIAAPDWYSLIVALCAGAAGMLSVTLSRSTALVGVAISITTIPAAADIGLSTAYADWDSWLGSAQQLTLNIAGLLVATTATLGIQRANYARRMWAHRVAMGLVASEAPHTEALGAELATPSSPATTRPRSSS